jgi:hypothetical protein
MTGVNLAYEIDRDAGAPVAARFIIATAQFEGPP